MTTAVVSLPGIRPEAPTGRDADDPVAAGYADRALFLVDGQIVGELDDPTPDTVLEWMKGLGA